MYVSDGGAVANGYLFQLSRLGCVFYSLRQLWFTSGISSSMGIW